MFDLEPMHDLTHTIIRSVGKWELTVYVPPARISRRHDISHACSDLMQRITCMDLPCNRSQLHSGEECSPEYSVSASMKILSSPGSKEPEIPSRCVTHCFRHLGILRVNT